VIEALCRKFGIDGAVRDAAVRAYERVSDLRYPAQQAAKANVMAAFLEEGVAEHDFAGSTGYGYDDAARERYESLLARVFGTERALARLSFVSGTHAIVTALAACVPAGKTLLSITGKPYDTLYNAIVTAPHSLVSQGINYGEVALRQAQGDTVTIDEVPVMLSLSKHDEAGDFDLQRIEQALENKNVAAVFVQRSRGYAPRPSVNIEQCEAAFSRIKAARPDVAILVDNCYGELVEDREPTHAGADLVMGSLIKNLGGGLAPAGGYVAGRADLVERVAARLYAPGLGDALGPTLGFGRAFIQGLFVAPLVVEQTLRGLDFAAALYSELGYPVDPAPGARRTDIVQAIRLGSIEKLKYFAQGLQTAMPVNARFRPEPGPVPGYVDAVIMSSGSFVGGATIELSCDAPLREPYEVYLQGGMIAEHTMLGAMLAAQNLGSGEPKVP
jgi:cystathionine beta-lyase family protein involved in aluminum resistance